MPYTTGTVAVPSTIDGRRSHTDGSPILAVNQARMKYSGGEFSPPALTSEIVDPRLPAEMSWNV